LVRSTSIRTFTWSRPASTIASAVSARRRLLQITDHTSTQEKPPVLAGAFLCRGGDGFVENTLDGRSVISEVGTDPGFFCGTQDFTKQRSAFHPPCHDLRRGDGKIGRRPVTRQTDNFLPKRIRQAFRRPAPGQEHAIDETLGAETVKQGAHLRRRGLGTNAPPAFAH